MWSDSRMMLEADRIQVGADRMEQEHLVGGRQGGSRHMQPVAECHKVEHPPGNPEGGNHSRGVVRRTQAGVPRNQGAELHKRGVDHCSQVAACYTLGAACCMVPEQVDGQGQNQAEAGPRIALEHQLLDGVPRTALEHQLATVACLVAYRARPGAWAALDSSPAARVLRRLGAWSHSRVGLLAPLQAGHHSRLDSRQAGRLGPLLVQGGYCQQPAPLVYARPFCSH